MIALSLGKKIVNFNKQNGTWHKVKYVEYEGWVWGGLVREGIPVSKSKYVVTSNDFSIYTQPISDSKLESRCKLSSSDFVTKESEVGEFSYVEYSYEGKSRKGYIKTIYLKEVPKQ